MEIVLVHPEIPHNSGCAARLAAALGLRLHLVEPLGFSLEDRYLKRAGLDYWPAVELVVHRDWPAAARALGKGSSRSFAERLRLFSARRRSLFETDFAPTTCSSSAAVRQAPPSSLAAHPARRVYVPIRPCVRSLQPPRTQVASRPTRASRLRAGVRCRTTTAPATRPTRRDEDVWPSHVARQGTSG
jgi:tRNA (cytidine/uridine-2'-O-)-methyltransferase